MMIAPSDLELLQAFIERRLPADQAAAVTTRLKSEPELARALVALVREEVVLRRWAVSAPAVDPTGPTAGSFTPSELALTAPLEEPPASADASRRPLRSLLRPGLIAAALLLTLGAALYVVSRRDGPESVERPGDANPPATPSVRTARLEEVQGEVYLLAEAAQVRAGSGQEIGPGQELDVRGDRSSAVLRYPDGTRLELGPGTRLRVLPDAATPSARHKQFYLAAGFVTAEVSPQPDGLPMILTTPHAEIRAGQARFSSQSGPTSTSLELDAGQAQFTRQSDRSTIEVNSGSYVVATLDAVDFAPVVLPPRVAQHRLSLSEGSGPVLSIALAPDGKVLASGGWDGSVRLWDTTSGQERALLLGHQKKVTSVAFSPDGKVLASGGEDKTIRLWQVATGAEQAVWPGHRDLRAVAFSPDGRLLAAGGTGKAAAEIRLWELASGKEVAVLAGHAQSISALAFAPDSQTLASGSRDGTVRLWDPAARKELAVLQDHVVPVTTVAFSPDGSMLAGGSNNGAIRLWDTATRTVRATFIHRGGTVAAVAFSADGKTLATGGAGGTASLWNVATGDELAVFKGHKYMVPCLALSRDGRTLATGGWDRTVKLWDLPRRLGLHRPE